MRHLLLLTVVLTCALHGGETAPDPAAIQAAMQKMSTLGPEHAALAKVVGEWEVVDSMWMAPGTPPLVSNSSATFTSQFGGRWIRQDYLGSMMGQPYVGMGLSGYDTVEKKYISTWCDGFSTAFSLMTGESKDGGKTITYHREMPHCPTTGGPVALRGVLVTESADRVVFTLYNTPKGGAEFRSMELVYTRKTATNATK